MTRANPSYMLKILIGDGLPCAGVVPVCVTRKRVRNLNLRVHRDGSVALSIPWHTSRERAQAFLDERVGWIARARARVLARAESADNSGSSRGVYPLWGEPHRPSDSSPLSDDELDALYRAEVARALPEVVARMEPLVGAHASAWKLRAMTSRWGSCTPRTGQIRINVRLAAYPRECLDYVVAHELAHLLEPSHNARFHAIVARAIPNEREVRARLRQSPS